MRVREKKVASYRDDDRQFDCAELLEKIERNFSLLQNNNKSYKSTLVIILNEL